jgi:hypothetical protein
MDPGFRRLDDGVGVEAPARVVRVDGLRKGSRRRAASGSYDESSRLAEKG